MRDETGRRHRHQIVMHGSSAPVALNQPFMRTVLSAVLLVGFGFAGCIDDRPSGPGRIRNPAGGTTSTSGSSSAGGSTASGGTTTLGQTAGSGGHTGAGGATASSETAGSGGHTTAGGATASSETAGSGGHSVGGTTGSSQTTGSGGHTGAGGATASTQTTGSGGSTSTTGATGGSRDAGTSAPPPHDAGSPADSAAPSDASVSFANQIQPLLKANCVSCHGPSKQNAGVRLDSYTAVKTNLTAATSAISGGIMPPSGGLSSAQRQLFQSWVDQGAPNN